MLSLVQTVKSRRTSLLFLIASCLFATVNIATGQSGGVYIKLSDVEFDQPRFLQSAALSKRTSKEVPFVLILPGILGERFWDRNVRTGISSSSFGGEVEIYDWTKGPLMMAANIGGDAKQSESIATRLIRFKQQNPSRPIFLVGHSGGCRMVVQVLEKLPASFEIERGILLSPCLESTYNLLPALKSTRSGIVSFFSPLDVPVSVPLTAVHGLARGRLEISATTLGFRVPAGLTEDEKTIYRTKLIQQKFDSSMISTGHVGGHFGWTAPKFVSSYVAPFLVAAD